MSMLNVELYLFIPFHRRRLRHQADETNYHYNRTCAVVPIRTIYNTTTINFKPDKRTN